MRWLAAYSPCGNFAQESVEFTGGEPLVRNDFLSIVRKIGELGLRMTVATNGTLVDETVLEVFRKYGVSVIVSLDGYTAEAHDAIRGLGSYNSAVRSIRHAAIAGLKVAACMTVNRTNFSHIRPLVRFASLNGCSRIILSEIVNLGRATEHWPDLALTPTERQELFLVADDTARAVLDEPLLHLNGNCWIDGSTVFISSDGRLYFCTELFQRWPDLSITHVRNPEMAELLRDAFRTWRRPSGSCCYQVYASSRMTLVANQESRCAWARERGRT